MPVGISSKETAFVRQVAVVGGSLVLWKIFLSIAALVLINFNRLMVVIWSVMFVVFSEFARYRHVIGHNSKFTCYKPQRIKFRSYFFPLFFYHCSYKHHLCCESIGPYIGLLGFLH